MLFLASGKQILFYGDNLTFSPTGWRFVHWSFHYNVPRSIGKTSCTSWYVDVGLWSFLHFASLGHLSYDAWQKICVVVLTHKSWNTSIYSHVSPLQPRVKSIILKDLKLLQNDSETGTIFLQHPLISFKRDKNMGISLVRSSLQTDDQPGIFKCARSRCKTCPFIYNVEKMWGPKRFIKITDHFTCNTANVIYWIYTLHLLQKVIHWWNVKTTGRPIPRTPSQRRKKCQRLIQTSN